MPRYYFDTKDGGLSTHDDTGVVFHDPNEMRRAAMALLPSMASDEMEGVESHVFVVRVRDEQGSITFHASLALVADWID